MTALQPPDALPLGPFVAPAGFWMAATSEVLAGAALVKRAALYLLPAEGLVR